MLRLVWELPAFQAVVGHRPSLLQMPLLDSDVFGLAAVSDQEIVVRDFREPVCLSGLTRSLSCPSCWRNCSQTRRRQLRQTARRARDRSRD